MIEQGKNTVKGKDHNHFLPKGMRDLMGSLPTTRIKGVDNVKVEDLDKWLHQHGGWTIAIAEVAVEVEQELVSVFDKVKASAEKYQDATKQLRSTMGNDVSSIGSSASKILAEMSKINGAVTKLQNEMTSDKMILAISNAERLAKALESISAVQANNITFAVLSKGKSEAP